MPIRRITPEELFQKMNNEEKVFLLDVRAEEKYEDYHIVGHPIESQNIHKAEIFTLEEDKGKTIDSLPNDTEIIVTCTTGNSATKCANILSKHEYDVAVLSGGITAWKEFLRTKEGV